ncbi:ChuX/HutX family heme-like substrate-binding protein [Klebsiella pneumoniae]|uniref:ChuX/HutX family heme-like substrate-binding protein n=1 Tax=Klebsiella pneumoniae TaxID=573 RepID=UPI0023816E95|nr:ChuX/HutX family heme-like substrate-binding protein [Klebsiella pneumoniae]MDE4690920.1 hypothetical protein [Klebsiella pneumoniae]
MPNAHPDLWQRYQATKAASTAKYARDIAAEMGISEAELTAARLGHDAVRLSDDARALIAALENDWRAMTDVHQFFGLLRKYQLSRQQAFRLVSDDLACRVDRHALPSLLETVRQEGNEIMIFVGNRGCVQIFTGALEKLAPMRGWLNIFNTTFTLHLREESLDEVWVTRKPTSDGHVTSVELFAKDGTQIAQLYGQRSEGHPEQTQWRQQVDRLTREGQPA